MSPRGLRWIVVAVLLAPSAAGHDLDGDWTVLGGTPQRVGAATNEGASQGSILWSVTFDAPDASSAVVQDGVVYHAYQRIMEDNETRGWIYAYDFSTGAVKWSVQLDNAIRSTPVVNGDTVYVAANTNKGTVYALATADGAKRWHYTLDTHILSSPVVADGTLYAADNRGNINALDAATGALKWKWSDGVAVPNKNSIAVQGDLLYLGTYSGGVGCHQPCSNDFVYAVRRADGGLAWKADPTEATSTDDDIVTTVNTVGGLVLVSAKHVKYTNKPSIPGRLFALDAATGVTKWTKATDGSTFHEAAAQDGVLYVGNNNGKVYALDVATGDEKWSVAVGNAVTTPVAVTGSVAYVGAVDTDTETTMVGGEPVSYPVVSARRLHAISTANGAEFWKVSLDRTPSGWPAIAGGRVAVNTVEDNQATLVVIGANPGSHAANAAPILTGFSPTGAVPPDAGTTNLLWQGTDADGDALRYDLYFGTSDPPALVNHLQPGASWTAGALASGETYRWRVVAYDSHGSKADSGPLTIAVGGERITTTVPSETTTNDPVLPPGGAGKRSPGPDVVALLGLFVALAWLRRP